MRDRAQAMVDPWFETILMTVPIVGAAIIGEQYGISRGYSILAGGFVAMLLVSVLVLVAKYRGGSDE